MRRWRWLSSARRRWGARPSSSFRRGTHGKLLAARAAAAAPGAGHAEVAVVAAAAEAVVGIDHETRFLLWKPGFFPQRSETRFRSQKPGFAITSSGDPERTPTAAR